VEIKLYKLNWRGWWQKGSEDLTSYLSSRHRSEIKKDTVKVVKGKGGWKLRIKYPQWGRYLIRARDLEQGHATGRIVYIDWPGWAGRGQKDMPGGATVLSFTADKAEYKVGETVILTIPTSKKGRGLVSIESGSRTIQTHWINASQKQTKFQFTATEEMTPNVYANVTLIQPHMQAENDLPIRLYGVIPIKVFDPQTRLKPLIESKDVFEPLAKSEIIVKEEQGRPMTYTLAVVDEGLLDLTRFKTPDLWEHFYRREALGVRTWDVYEYVVGAYGGNLERLLSIGGDGAEEPKAQSKANRFPPVVRFIGPVNLKKGARNRHVIDMPQYVGSVRVMVVAGRQGAYGTAEKAVPVRKPLMILATLPRVLGPQEEVELPVSVFALEKKIKKVKVSVGTNRMVKVFDQMIKEVILKEPGDTVINFKIMAGQATGIARVDVTARGGGERVAQKIEIDVRNPNQAVVDVYEKILEANKKWLVNFAFPGIPGTNRAVLEVSRIPPLNLEGRLDYLIRYPHGCVEQTISSAFPQLCLNKLVDLDDAQKQRVENNITTGITRISTFQNAGGGFGYWPNDSRGNEWSTNYAGHFLLEAKRLGYALPRGIKSQWIKYQRSMARSWSDRGTRSDLMQAYRLYTLALAKSAEMGAMNRLREIKNLSNTARWRLAAAYELSGQSQAAQAVIRNAIQRAFKYLRIGHTG
jgi:uncharacterized protein YfaS (alpha-2-macroglobulin family)